MRSESVHDVVSFSSPPDRNSAHPDIPEGSTLILDAMSGEGVRRLLPQSSQMQSFSFAPNNYVPRENQKNYVFVDEHNRHKRLKVMRACEGCRRRKIKCDAATTNTWPCSACIRLKLHCIPPTVSYDSGNGQGFENEGVEYEHVGNDAFHNQVSMQQQLAASQKGPHQAFPQQVQYSDPIGVYHPVSYGQPPTAQQPLQFHNIQGGVGSIDNHYPAHNVYPVTPVQPHHQPDVASPGSYSQEQFDQQALADLLGDLQMSEAGTAPYLNNKNKPTFAEEPAFEDLDEYKQALPSVTSGPDMKIRIPPELMPDEDTAMHYFDLYFTNVHPYCPVLNKTLFYQQWHSNRNSISPLVLEAIFAIAGRLADEPSQGQQWLALAGKHADSFMDVPRLSTLQAMIIVLKARESAPKRGYYYRSWMTVVQLIAMAKDLGLDEHYGEHRSGRSCGSSPTDCSTKTRIWQTLFAVELMVGASQGRTDLNVEMDSLDLGIPRHIQGEESEYVVTRNFTYMARCIRIVRRTNDAFGRVRKKKDWGLDPELVQLNPSFETWMSDLPSDLQITFPPDGSPPWLPSHFIGNLHAYYYLGIIILHRPQLNFMDRTGLDGGWKQHMMICYESAKLLCRVQEGVLQSFGLPGLVCMLRGINMTIYMILTCTVLHLVAMTSPDPDLNGDARDYFTRHMRILERCTSSWPMQDMQHQIDALREAFSADTRKPFVLKPTFPYGSPGASINASPPRIAQYHQQPHISRTSSMDQQAVDHHHVTQVSQVSYNNHPMTPPISAGSVDNKSDSPAVQSLVMMATGQRMPQQQQSQQSMPGSLPMGDTSTWNPSRIFDQWNTTFGTAPSSLPQTTSAPQTTPLRISHSSGPNEAHNLPELQSPPNGLSIPSNTQPMGPQQYSGAPIPSFVSPSMWQESVASVYEGGLKRQWDYDDSSMVKQASKRPR